MVCTPAVREECLSEKQTGRNRLKAALLFTVKL